MTASPTLFSQVLERTLRKNILCIRLPRWSITRRFRRQPEFRRAPVGVVERVGQRQQLAAVSEAAETHGIRPGMTLAEARSLCPAILGVEHEPAVDQRALEALGRWMTRFTPVVATGWENEDESPIGRAAQPRSKAPRSAKVKRRPAGPTPHVLFLDLTGCDRLFGSIDLIVQRITQAMQRFGIPAALAVAPTPGAAWAFALCEQHNGRVVGAADLADALADLPTASLRLDDVVLHALHHLGLCTIGQIVNIPRSEFPSRFGPTLLLRLDQALGDRPELLTPLAYEVPIAARLEFEAPIDDLETVWAVVETLIGRVVLDLARRGRGARQIDLVCWPDPFISRQPLIKTVNLSRPMRDAKALVKLFHCVTERLNLKHGMACLQLKVVVHDLVTDEQAGLLDGESLAEQMELDRLIERLQVRLGESAIVRPMLVESYLPERAWRVGSALSYEQATSAAPHVGAARPICLWPRPVEISVISEPSNDRAGAPHQFTWREQSHALVHVSGPERIAGEWWRGHPRTRDYYDVEDTHGQRFLLFRVMRALDENRFLVRWYLHGQFT